MSLQFEEKVIGDNLWRVPRVLDVDRFVVTIGIFLPLQTVVLNVVDGFEKDDSKSCLDQMEGEDLVSKDTPNSNAVRETDQIPLNESVVEGES